MNERVNCSMKYEVIRCQDKHRKWSRCSSINTAIEWFPYSYTKKVYILTHSSHFPKQVYVVEILGTLALILSIWMS